MTAARRERPARYAPTPWAQQRLYRPFVRGALVVGLVPGFALGAAVLAEHLVGRALPGRAALVDLHGVAQIFGWAGLFVMGIASHVVPRFRGNVRIAFPWPQRVALWAVVGALALRGGTIIVPHPGWLVASAVALVVGVSTWVATVGDVLRRGTTTGVPFERWAWAGFAFALVAAGLYLALALSAARSGTPSAALERATIAAGLYGFVGDFVLGISLRAVAAFLHLRPRRVRLERVAFGAANLGAALLAVAPVFAPGRTMEAAGALLYAAGAIGLTVALRIFEAPGPRPSDPPPERTDQYPRFGRFFRVAYGWLVVAALLLALEGAAGLAGTPPGWRTLPVMHTFAVGFVTMVIFGFAVRVLPLLEGRPLSSSTLADAAFALLNLAVVLRLAGGVANLPGSAAALAISGFAGLGALVCFAVNAWPRGARARGV